MLSRHVKMDRPAVLARLQQARYRAQIVAARIKQQLAAHGGGIDLHRVATVHHLRGCGAGGYQKD
jgi:hypothetical protein